MLTPPEVLADHHDLGQFRSDVPSLDAWLQRRARANQVSGASRTFVVSDDGRVAAYYCLASGAVAVEMAPGRFRRNMPDPVPVIVLGRLAVDREYRSRGLGRALFRDAALRSLQASEIIGVRGILVHALSEEARRFYLGLGLDTSPIEPMTLMATLADLRATIGPGS